MSFLFPPNLATPVQRANFRRRLRSPGYWLQQIPHAILGALAWCPLVLAFVVYREIRQAATGDGVGRPSLTTGWLDPLLDLAGYCLGSALALAAALVWWFLIR